MGLVPMNDFDYKVYNEELKDFLPQKILDVHTHIWLNKYVDWKDVEEASKGQRNVTWPDKVASENSIEDLEETYKEMLPGKDVKALLFTSKRASKENNAYVARCSQKTGWPALYYSHPEETGEELEKIILKGHFLGLKSYLDLSPKYIPNGEIRIFDFFPEYQLKKMNEMGAMVMLHIPRNGRLKDPVNLAQMLEIYRKYPNIRLIIAHIGRAYVPEDVGNAFDVLNAAPEMMIDFTANCTESIIEEALRRRGTKHLMFGSDMPILRMRMRRIDDNGHYVNIVPRGLYGDVSDDSHMREVDSPEADRLTFFLYEELRAFKKAAENLGLSRQDVEDVMYNNAVEMIRGAERSIYGKEECDI